MKVEKRRGGWFAVPHNEAAKNLSGPWVTKKAADLAAEGKFHEAHNVDLHGLVRRVERIRRPSWRA